MKSADNKIKIYLLDLLWLLIGWSTDIKIISYMDGLMQETRVSQ